MSEFLAIAIPLGHAILWVLAFLVLGYIVRALDRLKRELREATYWAGIARRDAEAAERLSAEGMLRRREALGPWGALVDAIEGAPEGRLQIPTLRFEAAPTLPTEDEVNRYLFDRWPGLTVFREDSPEYLGVIVRWADRP